jgi:hypothetical protein
MWAVELRREESRGRSQNLVRASELTVLLLEALELGPFFGAQPGSLAPVDLGLAHPRSQRLIADPELAGDSAHHSIALTGLGERFEDHAHRSLFELRWIPLLGSLICWHFSILSKRWSLNKFQGGSKCSRVVAQKADIVELLLSN